MLIGGVAVIAHGVRRLTDDVDATLWAEGLDLDRVIRQLAREGIVPRIADAVEFVKRSQVLLLRHAPSGIDVDLSLAWLPFESAALDRPGVVRAQTIDQKFKLGAETESCRAAPQDKF